MEVADVPDETNSVVVAVATDVIDPVREDVLIPDDDDDNDDVDVDAIVDIY